MPFQRAARKIVLWGSRLSFPHVFQAEHVKVNGRIVSNEKRFSTRVLVNPSLVAAVQALEEEVIRESWPEGLPPGIQVKRALQPGETVAPNDPQMRGFMILSANAKEESPPQIVSIHKGADGRFLPLTDRSLIYSGCEAHVHVSLYTTQIQTTNPQINCGLNAIQPTERPMDRFDGRTSADEAFGDAPPEYAPPPGGYPDPAQQAAPGYVPPQQPGAGGAYNAPPAHAPAAGNAPQVDQWGVPIA